MDGVAQVAQVEGRLVGESGDEETSAMVVAAMAAAAVAILGEIGETEAGLVGMKRSTDTVQEFFRMLRNSQHCGGMGWSGRPSSRTVCNHRRRAAKSSTHSEAEWAPHWETAEA